MIGCKSDESDGFAVLEEAARMLIATSNGEELLEVYRHALERLLIEEEIDAQLASAIAEKFLWIIVRRANDIEYGAST